MHFGEDAPKRSRPDAGHPGASSILWKKYNEELGGLFLGKQTEPPIVTETAQEKIKG